MIERQETPLERERRLGGGSGGTLEGIMGAKRKAPVGFITRAEFRSLLGWGERKFAERLAMEELIPPAIEDGPRSRYWSEEEARAWIAARLPKPNEWQAKRIREGKQK